MVWTENPHTYGAYVDYSESSMEKCAEEANAHTLRNPLAQQHFYCREQGRHALNFRKLLLFAQRQLMRQSSRLFRSPTQAKQRWTTYAPCHIDPFFPPKECFRKYCVWHVRRVVVLRTNMPGFHESHVYGLECRACKYSQLHMRYIQWSTHLSTHVEHERTERKTPRLQPAHTQGLAHCHRVILDSVTPPWVQAGHPRYTRARTREGRGWPDSNSTT